MMRGIKRKEVDPRAGGGPGAGNGDSARDAGAMVMQLCGALKAPNDRWVELKSGKVGEPNFGAGPPPNNQPQLPRGWRPPDTGIQETDPSGRAFARDGSGRWHLLAR